MFNPFHSSVRTSPMRAVGISALFLCAQAFPQCTVTIKAPDFSVCPPRNWGSRVSEPEDKVELCNRAELKQCQSVPFGTPDYGAVVLTIMPSDQGYGIYQSPEDLMRRARTTGQPPPLVSDVELPGADDGHGRKCWVARALLPGGIWQDTYALTVGNRRFRVSALYNNEADKIGSYREECRRVLASVVPIGRADRKGGR